MNIRWKKRRGVGGEVTLSGVVGLLRSLGWGRHCQLLVSLACLFPDRCGCSASAGDQSPQPRVPH